MVTPVELSRVLASNIYAALVEAQRRPVDGVGVRKDDAYHANRTTDQQIRRERTGRAVVGRANMSEREQRFPRRIRVDKQVPAERAINQAAHEIEQLGADERLTQAVVMLGEVFELVADFVDGDPSDPDLLRGAPQEPVAWIAEIEMLYDGRIERHRLGPYGTRREADKVAERERRVTGRAVRIIPLVEAGEESHQGEQEPSSRPAEPAETTP